MKLIRCSKTHVNSLQITMDCSGFRPTLCRESEVTHATRRGQSHGFRRTWPDGWPLPSKHTLHKRALAMSKTPGMSPLLCGSKRGQASHNAGVTRSQATAVSSIKKLDLACQVNVSSSSHRSTRPPLFTTTVTAFHWLLPICQSKTSLSCWRTKME